MELFFFSKYSKFNANSENSIKKPENVLTFSDNGISSGSGKLSVLLREYSQLEVKVLKSNPEISDLPKKHSF